MARFKILAEIVITGDEIKIERDALMAMQEMLGAYDDMTETTSSTSIMINAIRTEKGFDGREEQILIDSMRDRISRLYKMSEAYRDGDNKEAQMDCLAEKKEKIRPHVIPEVGATGTIHWYSDSSKAKVTRVISPKKIEVTACGLYSCTKIYTFRSNGHWVQEGSTSRDWATLFSWGRGHDYYDQSY